MLSIFQQPNLPLSIDAQFRLDLSLSLKLRRIQMIKDALVISQQTMTILVEGREWS